MVMNIYHSVTARLIVEIPLFGFERFVRDQLPYENAGGAPQRIGIIGGENLILGVLQVLAKGAIVVEGVQELPQDEQDQLQPSNQRQETSVTPRHPSGLFLFLFHALRGFCLIIFWVKRV